MNKEITTTNKKQRVSSSEIIRVAAQKTDQIGELVYISIYDYLLSCLFKPF